jgi:thiamine biosynthesis lipoprotein
VKALPENPAGATWPALGSTAVLRVCDPRRLDAARAAVEQVLAEVDAACSRFRSDSELSRVNASSGRITRVSPLLFEALELAVRASDLTVGDVDPTVGGVLEVLGYDRDWQQVPAHAGPVPGPARLRIRRGRAALFLDRATLSVRVPHGVALDLGATAKAWAADRASAAAAAGAGCGVLVGLGGDIAVAGPPPPTGWPIRVTDDHCSSADAPGQTVTITSGGLATSSTTVRRWDRGGRAMHHIVDPRTGWPAGEHWRTVSVAASTCADANIAATASIVRGAGAAGWLNGLGLPARLVDHSGRKTFVGDWPADHADRVAA